MINSAWRETDEHHDPPVEAVVGGWFMDGDGATGLFRLNPGYEPSRPRLPTDPVDAAVQLVVDGDAVFDALTQVVPGSRWTATAILPHSSGIRARTSSTSGSSA